MIQVINSIFMVKVCSDLNKNPLWNFDDVCWLTDNEPTLVTTYQIKQITNLPLTTTTYFDGIEPKILCNYAILQLENVIIRDAMFTIDFSTTVPFMCDNVVVGLATSAINSVLDNVSIIAVFDLRAEVLGKNVKANFSLINNIVTTNITNCNLTILDQNSDVAHEPYYMKLDGFSLSNHGTLSRVTPGKNITLMFQNKSVQVCENETERELEYPTVPGCALYIPIDTSAGSGAEEVIVDNIVQCHKALNSQNVGGCHDACYSYYTKIDGKEDQFRCYFKSTTAIGCENEGCKCTECPDDKLFFRDPELNLLEHQCVNSCQDANPDGFYFIWNFKFCVAECLESDYVWKYEGQLHCVQKCPDHLRIGNMSGEQGFEHEIFNTHLACVECETTLSYELVVQNGICVLSCYESFILTKDGSCQKECPLDQTPILKEVNGIVQQVCMFCHEINQTWAFIENFTLECRTNCNPQVHGENFSCNETCPEFLFQDPFYFCVPVCESEMYNNGTHCLVECPDGFFINSSAMTCLVDCPLDKFKNDKYCVDLCPAGHPPLQDKTCQRCDKYYDEVNKICVPVCSGGLFEIISGINTCWTGGSGGSCNSTVETEDGAKQCWDGSWKNVRTSIIPIRQQCQHMFSTNIWNIGCTMINETSSFNQVINIINLTLKENYDGKGGCLYYFLNLENSSLSNKLLYFSYNISPSPQCNHVKISPFGSLIHSQLSNIILRGSVNIPAQFNQLPNSYFAFMTLNASICNINVTMVVNQVKLNNLPFNGSLISSCNTTKEFLISTVEFQYSYNYSFITILVETKLHLTPAVNETYSFQDSCNEMTRDIANMDEFDCNSSTHRCFYGFQPMICNINCSCRYCMQFSMINAVKSPPQCTNTPHCPSGTYLQGILCVSKCDPRYITYGKICLLGCPDGMVEENNTCLPCGTLFAHKRENRCVLHCDDFVQALGNCQETCPEGQFPTIQGDRIVCKNCNSTSNFMYFNGFCVSKCSANQAQLNQICYDSCPYGLIENQSNYCVMECNNSFDEDFKCVSRCSDGRYNDTFGTRQQCRQNCSFGGPYSSYISYAHCVVQCSIIEELNNYSRKCIQICKEGMELNLAKFICDICEFWNRLNSSCQIDPCQYLNVSDNHQLCEQIDTPYCKVLLNNVCADNCSETLPFRNQDYQCQSFCPDYFTNESGYLQCSENCFNFFIQYGENRECVVSCPNGWNISGVQCINSSCYDFDSSYKYNLNGKCVNDCSGFIPNHFTNLTTMNCTDRCYPGYHDTSDSRFVCTSDCPFYVYNALLNAQECFAECPSQFPFIGVNGKECLAFCPAAQFLSSNKKNCLINCSSGEFYYVAQAVQYCVSTCPSQQPFVDRLQCVATCSTDRPYHTVNNSIKTCVAQCKIFYNSTTKLCVDTCLDYINQSSGKQCMSSCSYYSYISLNGSQYCTDNCQSSQYIYHYEPNKTCVSSCFDTAFHFVDNSTKVCMQKCTYFVIKALTEYICVTECPQKQYVQSKLGSDNIMLCAICKVSNYNFSLFNISNNHHQCLVDCLTIFISGLTSNNCTSTCNNLLYYKQQQKYCLNDCKITNDKKYTNGSQCFENCSLSNKLFVQSISSFVCVSSCPLFSIQNVQGDVCVSTCPLYIENKVCVDKCSNKLPYLSGQVCVLCDYYYQLSALKYCVNVSCSISDYPYLYNKTSKQCVSQCGQFQFIVSSGYCNNSCEDNYFEQVGNNKFCRQNCSIYKQVLVNSISFKQCVTKCDQILHLNGECNVSDCKIEGFQQGNICVLNCSDFVENISNTMFCIQSCPLKQYIDSMYQGLIIKLCQQCQNFTELMISINALKCIQSCDTPKYILDNLTCVSHCDMYDFISNNLQYCVIDCLKTQHFQFSYMNQCVFKCSDIVNGSILNLVAKTCQVNCDLIENYNLSDTICVSSCSPNNPFIQDQLCVENCGNQYVNKSNKQCVDCLYFYIDSNINYCLEKPCANTEFPFQMQNSQECVKNCSNFVQSLNNIDFCVNTCDDSYFTIVQGVKYCLTNCDDYDVSEPQIDGTILCKSTCNNIIHLDKSCSEQDCNEEGFLSHDSKRCLIECPFFVVKLSNYTLICSPFCEGEMYTSITHAAINVDFALCQKCDKFYVVNNSILLSYKYCSDSCSDSLSYHDKKECLVCQALEYIDNSVKYCMVDCKSNNLFLLSENKSCVQSCFNTNFPFVESIIEWKCTSSCIYILQIQNAEYYCQLSCPIAFLAIQVSGLFVNICVSQCDHYYYLEETGIMQCVASCSFYIQDLDGKLCVDECNDYIYHDSFCISSCSLTDNPYYFEQHCYDSCKSPFEYLLENSNECVNICDSNLVIDQSNNQLICRSNCPDSKPFIDDQICMQACPGDKFVNASSSKCELCNYFYLNNGIKYCSNNCSVSPFIFIDEITKQCVDFCPKYIMNNICVQDCQSKVFEIIDNNNFCQDDCPIYETSKDHVGYKICIAFCDLILHQNGNCSVDNCNEEGFLDNELSVCVSLCEGFVHNNLGILVCNSTCSFNSFSMNSFIKDGNIVQYKLCEECHSYYYPQESMKKCVDNCDFGHFVDGVIQNLCLWFCNDFLLKLDSDLQYCYEQCPSDYPSKEIDNGIKYCIFQCSKYINNQGYCVTDCPLPYYELNQITNIKYCLDICSDYFVADGNYSHCVSTCPNGLYINKMECVLSCSPLYQSNLQCVGQCSQSQLIFSNNTNMLCQSTCLIGYIQIQIEKYCVENCSYYVIDQINQKLCYAQCPATMQYTQPNSQECLSHCLPSQFIGSNNICITECDVDQVILYSEMQFYCVHTCPLNQSFVVDGKCSNKCPENFIFIQLVNFNKVCSSSCPKFVNSSNFCDDSCLSLIYQIIKQSKYCIDSCDKYYIQQSLYQQCVDICPDNLFAQNQECVISCQHGFAKYIENGVKQCIPCSLFINLQGFCVPQCDQDQFIALGYCVDSCPSGTISKPDHVCESFQCNGTILMDYFCIPKCLGQQVGLSNNSCVTICPGGQFTGLIKCSGVSVDQVTETTGTDDRIELKRCDSPRILIEHECILFLCETNQWYWGTKCYSQCSGIKHQGVCFPNCQMISQALIYLSGQCVTSCPEGYIAIDGYCLHYDGADNEFYPGNGNGNGGGEGGNPQPDPEACS